MISTSLLLLATLAPPVGPVDLVADLGHNTPDFGYDFVFGTAWAEHDGVVYFLFDDGIHGLEAWRSDGTALGTFLLRDVCPGSCSGAAWRIIGPGVQAAAAGRVFFWGDDGIHGPELWSTDGTALGTSMVRELVPGKGGIVISRMLEAAGQLFFLASEPGGTSAVWRSDGTAEGTFVFWDPAAHDAGSVSAIERGPGWLWAAAGGSLWRIDGTPEGTVEISPMSSPGYFNHHIRFFGATSTEAVFLTEDGLSASNGLPGGTATIGPGHTNAGFWIDGDVVLYARSVGPMSMRTLMRYSGGLVPPEDLGISAPASLWPQGTAVQLPTGTVVTSVSEPATGIELWAKPEEGAFSLLSDISLGETSSLAPWYSGGWFSSAAKRIGEHFMFLADDGVRGQELWATDGTSAGTTPLPELVAGSTGVATGQFSRMRDLFELPGPLFVRHITADGVKLARSDATPSGTFNVRTIGTQTSVEPRASWEQGCRAGVGRRLVVGTLSADGPPTSLVALVSGEGVEQLAAADPGDDWEPLPCAFAGNGLVAFVPRINGEARLIATDGTLDGTSEIAQVPFLRQSRMLSRGNDVVWGTDAGLWRSDGTSLGTSQIVAVDVGVPLATRSGLVLFSQGVLRGASFEPLSTLSLSLEPTALGGGFLALDSGVGRWLWIDGEPVAATPIGILGGSREVPEELLVLQQFNRTSPPLRFAATLDATRALLLIDDGKHGPELWVTDGSAAGSSLVADIRVGPRGSDPMELVQVREGLVAFVADDGVHGRELWMSDGTAAGTIQLDLLPGAASSRPERLTAIDGALLFSAWTPDFGREAWWSDGTAAGTARISDVGPGPKSSSPERFARAGRRLYFLATDHVLGFEWWSLDVPAWAGLFADGFESGDSSAWSAVATGSP